MAAMMTEKWQLWLSVGVILGVAPGMTALVVSATVASRWFTQRRGLVVGMLAAAVATGQLIFLPVAAWISEHYGWRAALMPTAAAVTVCGVLYALFAAITRLILVSHLMAKTKCCRSPPLLPAARSALVSGRSGRHRAYLLSGSVRYLLRLRSLLARSDGAAFCADSAQISASPPSRQLVCWP